MRPVDRLICEKTFPFSLGQFNCTPFYLENLTSLLCDTPKKDDKLSCLTSVSAFEIKIGNPIKYTIIAFSLLYDLVQRDCLIYTK